MKRWKQTSRSDSSVVLTMLLIFSPFYYWLTFSHMTFTHIWLFLVWAVSTLIFPLTDFFLTSDLFSSEHPLVFSLTGLFSPSPTLSPLPVFAHLTRSLVSLGGFSHLDFCLQYHQLALSPSRQHFNSVAARPSLRHLISCNSSVVSRFCKLCYNLL